MKLASNFFTLILFIIYLFIYATNIYVILAITTVVQKYLKFYTDVINVAKRERKWQVAVKNTREPAQTPRADQASFYFLLLTLLEMPPNFSPFVPSIHPHLLWPSHCCLWPWGMHMHICIYVLWLISPSLPYSFTSEICQSIHVSMPLVLFCLSIYFVL